MRKRIAVIDRQKCHPSECGDYLCAKLCPVNRAGGDCIYPGDDQHKKARIDELLCTGCGICVNRCPFKAIEILNLPESLNKPPVHRYGENMFELYSLPTPLFGQVTGIVGRNGLGKTTAFKIMANLLKPNLGKWQDPVEFKEVISYFKGTETQKFLEQLHDNKIVLSYKPQQVDLIPKQFKGTVRELLSKINAEKLEEVAKQLDLINFLENDISKVSGGELQRVAIAAAVLKEANLFLFDEPTSYLDIKQRINVSRFIRSLATEKVAPMVIEHDLVILDHMTDLVNIMYGFEGVFGIVSGIKSSREGINAFLDGYLKEENVRFRDHAIKFQNVSESKTTTRIPLVSWTKMKKVLGNFTLEAEPGKLNKNEIIGIVGENGIGKTSFVKILAGIMKPDQGEVNEKIKVSYKPQYLDTESDLTVVEFLQEAVTNYDNQLIQPLGLEKFFGQKLSELSGGQLQRVAIAHCLSQQATLFLLDEPSAYLDVEQRLLVSKIIKNVAHERDVTILVVDHDLMFIDYLSDRLIVFTGQPAVNGLLQGPFKMEEGMNKFLQSLNITLRRDIHSHRPRINKLESVKDREQRNEGKWYYS
ncbi:MAG: ribosome biogenesis/translation initiation ATPase RLI [Candidatus Woesearchaeota archaeon]